MKKLFTLLAVVMTAMLVACGGSNKAQEEAAPAEAAAAADELDFIRINCVLMVSAENKAKVIELAKELVAASLKDEGVIDYDILESVSQPDRLMIFETWKDQASLDKHQAADHFKMLLPQIRELATLKAKKVNQPKEVSIDTSKPFRYNIMKTSAQRDAYINALMGIIEGAAKSGTGCIDYDCYNSLTRPDKTMLLEIWENQTALETHLKSAYFTETHPKTRGLAEDIEFVRMQE